MNSYQVNGAPLGDGTPDNRVWLVLSTLIRATGSALLIAYKYLTGATSGLSTAVLRLNGTTYLEGATQGSATSSILLTHNREAPFGALGTTAIATQSSALTAWRTLTGGTTARSTTASVLSSFVALSMVTIARATLTGSVSPRADRATDAWTTRVPYANNETRVR